MNTFVDPTTVVQLFARGRAVDALKELLPPATAAARRYPVCILCSTQDMKHKVKVVEEYSLFVHNLLYACYHVIADQSLCWSLAMLTNLTTGRSVGQE